MQSGDGPLFRYRALIADGAIAPDPAQRAAVEKLQLLNTRLRTYKPAARRAIFGVFGFGRSGEAETGVRQGLYLFGGVGRGKSMLMDLFFDGAPIAPKRRVHFHAFMQEVQIGLNEARAAGASDAIQPVVERVAREAALLCFDEVQVTDIADAMILGRLFEGIFARGVVVVATSNRKPADLYKDGLNRHLFLPFIDMLNARLDVHELGGDRDFRTERLTGPVVYFSPLGARAAACMDAVWSERIGGARAAPLRLTVKGRTVEIPHAAEGAGRTSFKALCGTPLGPADYLAIAGALDTLFIDGIPKLSAANHAEARRFVTLIDALYEAKTRLICSADAEPEGLYPDGDGAFEFERTASRLEEMRSGDWAARRAEARR